MMNNLQEIKNKNKTHKCKTTGNFMVIHMITSIFIAVNMLKLCIYYELHRVIQKYATYFPIYCDVTLENSERKGRDMLLVTLTELACSFKIYINKKVTMKKKCKTDMLF